MATQISILAKEHTANQLRLTGQGVVGAFEDMTPAQFSEPPGQNLNPVAELVARLIRTDLELLQAMGWSDLPELPPFVLQAGSKRAPRVKTSDAVREFNHIRALLSNVVEKDIDINLLGSAPESITVPGQKIDTVWEALSVQSLISAMTAGEIGVSRRVLGLPVVAGEQILDLH